MSAQKPALIGVILAGGQSSRMGQDKATLSINGTSLLAFMRSKLRRAGFDDVVICRNESGYLNDVIAQLGPLGALYTLSRHYPGQRALIIPVDMPLFSAASLRAFLAAALGSDSRAAQLPATPGQQIFPLYLPFEPPIIAALSQRVSQPDDLSIAAFLRETGVRRLSGFDDRHDEQFLNANTPQQWQTILTRLKAHSESSHDETHQL